MTTAIDPVCGMAVDPATAAASAERDGKVIYFCSEGCRRRFLANPAAYADVVETATGPDRRAHPHDQHQKRVSPQLIGIAGGTGFLASALILSFYFGVLTLVSGWEFTV